MFKYKMFLIQKNKRMNIQTKLNNMKYLNNKWKNK